MKGRAKILAMFFTTLVIISTAQGDIIYVDDDGPADFSNIQAAINDANHGDTIIVSEGRYFENINFNGRNITLTSTDPCNPEVVAATIIDGNQNGSVVTFKSEEDANCVLNGFTITNGCAEVGGGIFCLGPLPPPPPPPPPLPPPPPPIPPNCPGPAITNCIISNNSAIGSERSGGVGGGMYNRGSNPTLTNCNFTKNSAIASERIGGVGGGMYNHGSNPTLTNCNFTNNSAISSKWYGSIGGGMYSLGIKATLINCNFTENSAYLGGGMHNYDKTKLINCKFIRNTAYLGGGMANESYFHIATIPTLTNCTFIENSASLTGGGMCNLGYRSEICNPILTNCIFNKNSAGDAGGGMFNNYSSPTINNCTFSGNLATTEEDSYGGAICNSYDSDPNINNCTFSNNSAWDGGAVYNFDSDPYISNCIFTGNIVENYGGGMYNYDESYASVVNSIFSGNRAEYAGGGIANSDSSNLTLTNCTISENWAHIGGGICSWNDVDTNLTNCILWDNDANNICAEIYNDMDSYLVISYSDIKGVGIGSIDQDPCFFEVEPDTGSWTADASYDESTFQSTLTNTGASWTVNQLAGKFINPDTSQVLHFFIVSNDVNTINVWSDVESFVISGDFYQIYDYHLKVESACIDAGDPNYPYDPNETDLDGRPRVIGCRIDMGAYEYSPPILVEIRIVPRTINLQSKGKWIAAFIQMPEDYDTNDIDANSVLLEGEIEPERFWLAEDNQVAIAKFSREEVQAIHTVGEVELIITGQLRDGTLFEGTDVIRVIDKGGGKN